MTRAAALALCLAVAGAAGADTPSPEYFAGTYERVGRSGEAPPALLNDLVRIDPTPGGALALRSCGTGPKEPGGLLILDFDRMGEVPTLLVARNGPFELWCQYFNDHDNYPVLTCGSDMGARFTLWAAPASQSKCTSGTPDN